MSQTDRYHFLAEDSSTAVDIFGSSLLTPTSQTSNFEVNQRSLFKHSTTITLVTKLSTARNQFVQSLNVN